MRKGVRLGVDAGSVRVGLAGCDPDGLLATPIETVPRAESSSADLDRIAQVAAERNALEVIVGLPRSLSGAEGPAARSVREYAELLAQKLFPISVRLLDERLTTIDAHRVLRDAHRPGRSRKGVVDQVAAVLILQAGLDLERSQGCPPGEAVEVRAAPTNRGQ